MIIYRDIKKFFENSDRLKMVIIGLVGFAIIVLIFGLGVKVGALKAGYSYRWAENYHKNFAGPANGFMNDLRQFPAEDFISGHGAFGEIIEITQNSFVIKGCENVEKIIIIGQNTAITRGKETIKDGLKISDRVVVIGSPNEKGQIEAKFIRVFGKDAVPGFPYRPLPTSLF
ncbi:MAG: hypothetical protein V1705_00070 [bacterium]